MYWVYDADSHVEEGEIAFSDRYWDQRYRGRRPIVVESDAMGNLSWMVDSQSFPRIFRPLAGKRWQPEQQEWSANGRVPVTGG